MTLRYTRRPILGGNARELIESQPSIRGQIRRNDLTLQFPGMALPASMSVAIDGGAPIGINFSGLVINTIISDINAALGVVGSAEDRGGYIVILSAGTGAGSSVEIQDSGLNDASALAGFPVSPDPLALVEGGDRAFSPAGGTENNPLGTYMAADGEDVTSDVLNRIAGALSVNADYLNACLEREVALPMILAVDSDTLGNPWIARVVQDGSGNIDQLNVGGLSAIDAGLSDRVYLGIGLDNQNSSLQDISDYFAVTDPARVEIIVGGSPVRVSGVTHGQRSGVAPTFLGDTVAPAVSLSDVAVWSPADGRGLLGVNLSKTGVVGIGEVLYRSAIRCPGATFVTNGVMPGDVATISGSGINVPFNHDDSYTVEQVFDEETILLRPQSPGDRGELNPGPGVLGNVEIFQGGLFSEDVWLTFDPPIPAVGGKAKFALILGGGYSLCGLPTDHLLRIAISTSEEVDDLVQKVIREMKGPLLDSTDDFTLPPFAHTLPAGNGYAGEPDVTMELLWRRISLQGAYDGQGRGGGGGYFVNVDWNAPEWNNLTPRNRQAGTATRTGAGPATIQAGNVVYIAGENFSLDDVGREFMVVPGGAGGGLRDYQSFVIIDYLDAEHVVVEPGENNPSIPAGGAYAYSIMQNRFNGFPASMSTHVLQSGSYGRLGYVHEEDRVAGREFGHHLLGIRESAQHENSATPMDVFDIVIAGGNSLVTMPATMDPSTTSNIRAFTDDSKDPSITPSIIRITEGQGNDGWYFVSRIFGATRQLQLQNFDGSIPTFVGDGGGPMTTARGHLYLPTQGYSLMRYLASDPGFADDLDVRIANLFFDDAKEWVEDRGAGVTPAHMGVVGIDWRGKSSGVVMRLNDPDLLSQTAGVGLTSGTATDIQSTEPARGVLARHWGNLGYGWAGAFIADTDTPWYNKDKTGVGTALYAGQMGTDTALFVVGRQEGGGPHQDPPEPNDLLPSGIQSRASAFIARIDEWSMQQSGALELFGGVYQPDPRKYFPAAATINHHMLGGIYTELSGGARFSWSPIHADNYRYYELEDLGPPVTDTPVLARLGQPGQMHPFSNGGADIIVSDVRAPGFVASRSLYSSGFVLVGTGSEFNQDLSAYIGQQIKLIFDGGTLNAGNNGVYVIINAYRDEDPDQESIWEVRHPGLTLIDEVFHGGIEALWLGGRWHWSNLDIESFMALGTHRTIDPLVDPTDTFLGLGLLTSERTSMPLMGVNPFSGSIPGMMSDPCLGLNDYGFGLGTNPTIAGLFAESLVPRPPIANAAWSPFGHFTLGAPEESIPSTDFAKLNFRTSEWVFRAPAPTSVVAAQTDYKDSDNRLTVAAYDAIMLSWKNGVASLDPLDVYALTRVATTLRRHHFRVRVRLTIRWVAPNSPGAATKDVPIFLADKTEVTPVSTTETATLVNKVTQDVNVYLTPTTANYSLREAEADTAELSFQAMLHLGLGLTRMDGGDDVTEKVFIYACHVTVEAVDAHHGALLNEGPVIASGFHLSTAAMDYKSYGPADAGPYSDSGFGAELPWWFQGKYKAQEHVAITGKIDPPSMPILTGAGLQKEDGTSGAEWGGDQGFLDLIPPSFFWRRGTHDACFHYVGRRFAAGSRHHSGLGGTPGVRDAFSGMVGHSIRLDPPHGSLMSTLRVASSIFNAVSTGVYNDAACSGGAGGEVSGHGPGFVLELLRHSVLPVGDTPARRVGTIAVTDYTFGFGEIIGRAVVTVNNNPWSSGTTPPNTSWEAECDDSSSITQNTTVEGLAEDFYLTTLDLMGEHEGDVLVADKSMLFVDRRQYAYSLVMRAFGSGDPDVDMSLFGYDKTSTTPKFHSLGVSFDGMTEGVDAVDPVSEIMTKFSKLKFRGATMGCLFTRMNP